MSRKKVTITLMLLLMATGVCIGYQPVPDLREKLGKILKWCFGEQLSLFITTTDLIDTFHGPMWDDDPVVLIQIDKHFDSGKSQWIHQRWPTFALTVDSEETLEFLLQKLKASTYWNIKSKLFIVSDKGVCGDASKMLQVAWKMNLPSAFYLCHDVEEGVLLYTLNPFTNRAPHPWINVENIKSSDERRTLYKRPFSEDFDLCQHLEYDKTKYLDGYKVRVTATPETRVKFEKNKDYALSSMKKYLYPESAVILKNIWQSMNVTAVIHYNGDRYNRTLSESMAALMNGSYDIELNFHSLFHSPINVSPTYPFIQGEFAILTRHRNFLTPAEKISNYYTVEIMSLTIVVLVVTWLIFLIRNNGQRVPAFLEILRMVVSTGLLQKLERTPIRIYLFGVLWLILILNATFQGNLAAFLTRPERHDVESIRDLKIYNYDIYMRKSLFPLVPVELLMPISKNKIHLTDSGHCSEYVLKNSSSACIHARFTFYGTARENDLHISQSSLGTGYVAYWHHKDWPLIDKFNYYYWQLMESGWLVDHQDKMDRISMAKHRSKEEQATAPVIRALNLADLSFAYPILAVGLIISTMIFIVELRGWKGKSKVGPEIANESISYRGRFKMRNNIIIGYRDDGEK